MIIDTFFILKKKTHLLNFHIKTDLSEMDFSKSNNRSEFYCENFGCDVKPIKFHFYRPKIFKNASIDVHTKYNYDIPVPNPN